MANIQMTPGFTAAAAGLGTGSLGALDSGTVSQIQSMLQRIGYYQGPVTGQMDFATVAALGQFQYTAGFGVQPQFTDDMAFSLLNIHHYVANGLPAPTDVYQTLTLAKQYNPALQLNIPKLDQPAPGPVNLPAPTLPGPGVGGGGPAPAPLPAGITDQESATSILKATLSSWGFDPSQAQALADFGWDKIRTGASQAEILDGLYQHPVFNAAFPEYKARRDQGLPVSIQDILDYRQGASDLFHAYGLNTIYDTATAKTIVSNAIINDVSAAEFGDRIVKGFNEINTAPAEAKAVFGEWFGANSPQALAAYFLAPDHALPLLERQVQMAEISGAGRPFGINVGMSQADVLASMGVSQSAAQQGFQQIDYLSPLFDETIDEGGQDLTKEGAGVGAVFGTEAGAQGALQRRQDSRKAALSGSGGAFVTEKGVVGLGSSS